MIYFAAILLSQISPVAHAEAPYDRIKPWRYEKYLGQIDEVVHNGVTELPLYNSYNGTVGSFTSLPFSDSEGNTQEWLTAMSSSLNSIIVSHEFVKFMGAEVKTTNKKLIPIWKEYKVGGKLDYVVFDELVIGNMTLRNVTAVVESSITGFEDLDLRSDVPDIIIGMNLLQTAYQVLPSQGLIKLEGTADGSSLMSEYSSPTPYQNISGGKFSFAKEDTIIPSTNLLTEVLVNGKAEKLLLASSSFNTLAKIDESTISAQSDYEANYSSFQVGEDKASLVAINFAIDLELLPFDGVLGADFLSFFDMAVDPGSQQLALRPVTGNHVRQSFVPTHLQQLQSKIDEKVNEAAESSEEDGSAEPSASDWGNLMDVQLRLGELDAAYNSAIKRTELNPENCTYWLTASTLALKLNKVEEALSYAQKSSALYHQWWDISLNERLEIEAQQDKMKEEEQEEAKETQKSLASDAETVWHYTQKGQCHEADAQVAWSHIVNGQIDLVQDIYREKLDLDENLALATAYSAFIQNDLPLAQESLRQAIILDPRATKPAKAALSMWYADIGDWEQSKTLMTMTQKISISDNDPLTQAIEIDNIRAQEGAEATIELLKSRLSLAPNRLDTNYLYVRELKLAPTNDAYNAAVEKADAVFNKRLAILPSEQPLTASQYEVLAQYTRYLILTDRIEEAEDIITNRLKKQQFSHYYSALAYADFHAYNGDISAAMTELEKLTLDGLDARSIIHAILFRATASAE